MLVSVTVEYSCMTMAYSDDLVATFIYAPLQVGCLVTVTHTHV